MKEDLTPTRIESHKVTLPAMETPFEGGEVEESPSLDFSKANNSQYIPIIF